MIIKLQVVLVVVEDLIFDARYETVKLVNIELHIFEVSRLVKVVLLTAVFFVFTVTTLT